MDPLESSTDLLRQAMEQFQRNGSLSADMLGRMNTQINANTSAVQDNTKAFKNMYDAAKHVAQGFMSTAQLARQNREDFTSLNPAIRATGFALGKAGGVIGSGADSVGNALMGLASLVPGWGKIIAGGLGAIVKGVGSTLEAASEEVGKAVSAYGEFITNELQRVVTSFKEMSAVGATGANGMRGFIDMAVQSGLSYEQLSKIVTKNGETLALFSGNTLDGAKTLVGVSQAAQGFEEQFLKLGVGFEEQRDMYARAVKQELLIGTAQRNDYSALARAAKDYIFEINELTRLTGLQKDQAQALRERQLADVRFQATLANEGDRLDRNGKKVADGLLHISGVLTSRVGPTIGVGFQDALSNAGTEAARAFIMATGGAGRQIAEDYRRGRITQEEALAQIDESIRRKYATLGGYQTQAALGKLGTAFESLFPEMFKLVRGTKLTVAAQKEATQGTIDAANATDKETIEIVSAQKNLQQFAVSLDKLVSEKIIPNAATHVRIFTDALKNGINDLNELFGVSVGGGGGGARSGGGGGAGPGGAHLRADGSIVSPGDADYYQYNQPPGVGSYGSVRDLVSRAEGADYNTVYGGKTAALSDMTLEQVLAYQDQMLKGGSTSSAVGRYQFIQPTLYSLINRLKLDPKTTKFDAALQDRLADTLINDAGYTKYAGGDLSKPRFLENLSKIWAGLPSGPGGRSYYEGINGNRATIGWQDALGGFANGGITSGPKTGYTAMLHGTEAIVPLPNGKSIPVEMDGMNGKIGEQLTALNQQVLSLNELVSLMRVNNDISNKILRTAAT